jgi:hypothetical protein
MKTQALGWLATAVVAAGLNSSYHEGGLRWAHQIVDQVGYRTSAVMALATGHAERFAAEVRLEDRQREAGRCPFQAVLARAENRVAHSQAHFERIGDRFEERMNNRVQATIAVREAEQRARIDLETARIEAQRDRIQAQMERLHIPAVVVSAPVPKIDLCPRVQVSVPRMPAIKLPDFGGMHFDLPGGDTI